VWRDEKSPPSFIRPPSTQIAMTTSLGLSRTLLLVAVVGCCTLAAQHGDAADDDAEAGDGERAAENAAVAAPVVFESNVSTETFDELVFGTRRDGPHGWLDSLLRWKVDGVDRGALLTDAQKAKLQLAGRGDIKHFFDRVAEEQKPFLAVRENAVDRKVLHELQQSTHGLRISFVGGLFEDGSRFEKTVKRTLTTAQAQRREVLRTIARAGGQVESLNPVTNEVHDIVLSSTDFNDPGLTHIQEITELESLGLDSTQVTDAGLVHLAGLASLKVLDLSGTQVSGAGFVHLKGLTRLKVIYLRNAPVTDAGLAHLKELKNLEVLELAQTRVTDAGLGHLKELTRLKRLDLRGLKVTDAGMDSLRGLTNLERLILGDTHVTDAGLVPLQSLTRLQHLDLFGTEVTEAGLAPLQQSVPGLKVFR
jgi:hypothetical protein